jgi:hypothetical protein
LLPVSAKAKNDRAGARLRCFIIQLIT